MGSKVEYVDSSHVNVSNYVRNSKAVGVLWGIFSICYGIIIIVILATPEWVGDSSSVDSPGRFGLWNRCSYKSGLDLNGIGVEECTGTFGDFSIISSTTFKVATVLVGVATLLALLTIAALILFFFLRSTVVFHICGWLQLISGLLLSIAVIVFPIGWSAEDVRQICGSAADAYELDGCGIRWAYILAIIGCFDGFILSSLAFILATRHIKLQADNTNGSTLYKGEINGAYYGDSHSLAGSRKSLNMHPVLMIPQPGGDIDRYSEFSSRTGRTKSSAPYRQSYPSSLHNFQL